MLTLTAEIGLNHDGNWDRAFELIRQAKLAGADVAKFQFGWRHERGGVNHITPALARRLRDWCDYWEIEFMASIIDPEIMNLVDEVAPKRLKVASRTVTEHPDLVQRLLDSGKETFVSLGWWDEESWPFGPPNDQLRYVYCISQYPTYPSALAAFPEQFSETTHYGYSDHTHGIDACLLALARGARFVEKHFTLDKAHESVHNDHILSATPQEFRVLHEHGRAVSRLAEIARGERGGVGGKP